MFDENFTFSTRSSLSSSNASSPREPTRSVSPCSPLAAFPAPQYTVTDLAASLAGSRLRQEAQICYDSCSAYANTDDDAGWQLEPLSAIVPNLRSASRSRALPPRPSSPSRRAQRQSSARMLCSPLHHKEISALIARMINSNEQCSVLAAESGHASAVEDDEGYDSECFSSVGPSRRTSLAVPKARLQYRRSSDLKPTGACVKKAIRVRREKVSRRPRSEESEE